MLNKAIDKFNSFYRRDAKKIRKFFILIFLVNVIIINWSDVSWLFSFKFLSRGVNSVLESDQAAATVSRPKESSLPVALDKKSDYTDKDNSIVIPKLNLDVPLVVSDDATLDNLERALNAGVVHFPNSALPGEIGQIVILGHSAPIGWPKIKHDWVFSHLNELENGDEIVLNYNNRSFTYKVQNKIFLEKNQELPTSDLKDKQSVLYLITCWPPGENIRRLAVIAL